MMNQVWVKTFCLVIFSLNICSSENILKQLGQERSDGTPKEEVGEAFAISEIVDQNVNARGESLFVINDKETGEKFMCKVLPAGGPRRITSDCKRATAEEVDQLSANSNAPGAISNEELEEVRDPTPIHNDKQGKYSSKDNEIIRHKYQQVDGPPNVFHHIVSANELQTQLLPGLQQDTISAEHLRQEHANIGLADKNLDSKIRATALDRETKISEAVEAPTNLRTQKVEDSAAPFNEEDEKNIISLEENHEGIEQDSPSSKSARITPKISAKRGSTFADSLSLLKKELAGLALWKKHEDFSEAVYLYILTFCVVGALVLAVFGKRSNRADTSDASAKPTIRYRGISRATRDENKGRGFLEKFYRPEPYTYSQSSRPASGFNYGSYTSDLELQNFHEPLLSAGGQVVYM